jgi:KaiC/GvpD/RAD55 family RecA-like ATPase
VGAILRLPPELIEFSLREPPRSLLIRGEPGAGKSTLALGLLTAFRGRKVLITSRVAKSEIDQDYPWLRTEVDGPIEVIEALSTGSRVDAKARALQVSPDLISDALSAPELGQLWLPDPVIDAFSRIGPENPGMVVVDSWDALVEQYVGAPAPHRDQLPDRAEIERLMLSLLGRGRVHLVIVVEREGPSQLDYLVDGVVACELTSSQDRLERWTHLKKMRGVRVDHPWYPYTLEGGKFLCISPLPSDFRSRLRPPEPEPDARDGWLWPGSSAFATHFGRLQLGRMTLLEVAPDVPVEATTLFLSPIQAQVVTRGGHVLVILPPSLSPSDVWDAFRPLVTPAQFVAGVRIYSPAGLLPAGESVELLEKVMVAGPSAEGSPMSTRMPEASRFLREGGATGVPNLGTVWLNGLHAGTSEGPAAYSPDTFSGLVQQTLAGAGGHIVMVGTPSDPFVVGLQEIAATRISMQSRNGRVFVYGIRPLTTALVLAESDSLTAYHLIRIV